jgi:hypothetical protein
MNYAIIDAEQRSPEWFAARAGRVTASKAADVLALSKKDGKELAARRDYRTQLALEWLLQRPLDDGSGYQNADMARGVELEPDALAAYEAATGAVVRRTGFVASTERNIGVSTDGDVDNFTGLVEIKAPRPANHFGYIKAGVVPPEYVPHLVHGQLVTGAQWTDFVSYCPQFPPELQLIIVRFPRDEKQIASYDLALSLFLNEVDVEVQAIAALRLKAVA